MRLVDRLFLTSALALAAVALAASSASAITITQEPGNTACPAGPNVTAHVVTGGCHVTFTSTNVVLLIHTGLGETSLSSCAVSGELRVNSTGVGFATNQVFADVSAGSCTRRPCDEVNMAKLAWPAAIEGTGAAPTHELTFCLRPLVSGEGAMGTICTIHSAVSFAGHTYTVGGGGIESPCEGSPVEILGSGTSTATERLEIS